MDYESTFEGMYTSAQTHLRKMRKQYESIIEDLKARIPAGDEIVVKEIEFTNLVLGREEDQKRIRELEDERAQLVKTLEWYADDERYIQNYTNQGHSLKRSIDFDNGQKAKEAVKKYHPMPTWPGWVKK